MSLTNVPDRGHVVAPLGGPLDVHPGQRALALVVGRPPAPQDVLGVEDQQVAPARRQELRRRDLGAADLLAGLDDGRGLLALEVDAVDGLVRLVDDVRRAVRALDEGREVERLGVLGRLEREQVGRGDRYDAVQRVQAGDDLGPQRVDRAACRRWPPSPRRAACRPRSGAPWPCRGSSVTRSIPGPETWARSAWTLSIARLAGVHRADGLLLARAAEGIHRKPEPADDHDEGQRPRPPPAAGSRGATRAGVTRR